MAMRPPREAAKQETASIETFSRRKTRYFQSVFVETKSGIFNEIIGQKLPDFLSMTFT